jgi:hypothetical protein
MPQPPVPFVSSEVETPHAALGVSTSSLRPEVYPELDEGLDTNGCLVCFERPGN